MGKTIVILGGSFSGMKIAHSLLSKTLPLTKGLKVVIVSPSSHVYWNIAAPRAVVPGQIPDDKLFQPIKPAFAKYSSSNFELVVGSAKNVDPASKKVEVETEEGMRTIEYDSLIVTTGSSAIGKQPWKLQNMPYKESLALLHELQDKVKNAKSIVVGGGGVTGVETAGELGFEYGKTKEITLISKDNGVLQNFLTPAVASKSLAELKARNVKIISNTGIESTVELASGETEITLSNGDKMVVDVYLPATGLVPNTSFMPKDLLNSKGEILVDEYLAVKGVKDIWSCGDAAAIQANKVMYANQQAPVLAGNIQAELTGKAKTPYKINNKPMGAATVGRAKGFGAAGSWSLPGFIIYHMKVKSMMVENLNKAMAGTL